jgi:hypothetical protein
VQAEVDFFAAIKEARAREIRLAIPELEVKPPVAGVEWVTDQATFDYVMPCPSLRAHPSPMRTCPYMVTTKPA